MKFDRAHFLRWIEAKHPFLQDKSYKLVNLCLLHAKSGDKDIGITVFEPKDLTEDLLKRIDDRYTRSTDAQFTLYIPDFLKFRIEKFSPRSYLKTVYTPYIYSTCINGQIQIQKNIRVVSVDDSPVILKVLKKAMNEIGFMDTVSQISDPHKAVETIRMLKPDLVTLDIQMPGKTGVEVMRELMKYEKIPTLIISSLSLEDGSLVFEALNSGAFDYIRKPSLDEFDIFREDLKEKSLLAIEGVNSQLTPNIRPQANVVRRAVDWSTELLWCIGSSTGGTQALTRIFTTLPTNIPPTLVVQHIPPIYSRAFAESLNQLCPFTVKEAEHGESLLPNHVYIAPGGKQMGMRSTSKGYVIYITDDPEVNRFKPSVDYLFLDIAKHSKHKIVATILTGMGKDGAQGLLMLKQKGAKTFVQDEKSCAVYGMPRAAYEIGATNELVHIDQISQHLMSISANFKKSS